MENAAEFTRTELDESPLVLGDNRQFISQSLAEGNWFLPIQGEAGKQYRLCLLGEAADYKMEILSSVGDSRAIGGTWNPSKTDLIWTPVEGEIYHLRLAVENIINGDETQILFQSKGEGSTDENKPFKGLQAGHRVTLGEEDDEHFEPDRAGTGAIVLRLLSLPDGEEAILDSGFGSERAGERFLWTVANLKAAVDEVIDRRNNSGE